VEIFKGDDWELRAQVALWVTAGSFTLSADGFAFLYMERSYEAVNRGELRFIPVYGRPPGLSEALHEKLSTLSQIIYFENFLFLTSGGSEPTRTARIEKEFRDQLPVCHASSLSVIPHTHNVSTVFLSGAVQNVSVDDAHEGDFTCQGYSTRARRASD
jgi:hypothetical protein